MYKIIEVHENEITVIINKMGVNFCSAPTAVDTLKIVRVDVDDVDTCKFKKEKTRKERHFTNIKTASV